MRHFFSLCIPSNGFGLLFYLSQTSKFVTWVQNVKKAPDGIGALLFLCLLASLISRLHCRYAEHDAEVAVGIAGATDAETADLAGVLHVGPEAGAYVVVAYVDKA